MASAGLLVLGICVVAGIAHYIRIATQRRILDRNAALGIRTRATSRSDAAWHTGHVAASPWLLTAAITGYFGAVATALSIAMCAADVIPDFGVFIVGLSSLLITAIAIVRGAVVAHAAAASIGSGDETSS